MRARQPFCEKSLHPSPGGHKVMNVSRFGVKALLKLSLHLAFTGVLIIRNEMADYASVNFHLIKSLHP
jgi:hypothetical protein